VKGLLIIKRKKETKVKFELAVLLKGDFTPCLRQKSGSCIHHRRRTVIDLSKEGRVR
jgi:hypothetical protein